MKTQALLFTREDVTSSEQFLDNLNDMARRLEQLENREHCAAKHKAGVEQEILDAIRTVLKSGELQVRNSRGVALETVSELANAFWLLRTSE